LPDFSWYNIPKRGKNNQWPQNMYTKRPWNIPNGWEIFRMAT
jgi:hypothetical protein